MSELYIVITLTNQLARTPPNERSEEQSDLQPFWDIIADD